MKKHTRQQLAFDQDIYALPDTDKPNNPVLTVKKIKSTKKVKPVASESLQPFLPGMSRRGRPRAKNPIPATLRATESRKRRIEAGGKRIELLLEPSIAADLDTLTEHFKVSRGELVGRLISKAAKMIRRKI